MQACLEDSRLSIACPDHFHVDTPVRKGDGTAPLRQLPWKARQGGAKRLKVSSPEKGGSKEGSAGGQKTLGTKAPATIPARKSTVRLGEVEARKRGDQKFVQGRSLVAKKEDTGGEDSIEKTSPPQLEGGSARRKSLPPPLLGGVSSEGGAEADGLSPRNLTPRTRWRLNGNRELKSILPDVPKQKKPPSKEALEAYLRREAAKLLNKQEEIKKKRARYVEGLLEDGELQRELRKLAPSMYRVMKRFGKGVVKGDEEGVKGRQPIGHETTGDEKGVTEAGRRGVGGPFHDPLETPTKSGAIDRGQKSLLGSCGQLQKGGSSKKASEGVKGGSPAQPFGGLARVLGAAEIAQNLARAQTLEGSRSTFRARARKSTGGRSATKVAKTLDDVDHGLFGVVEAVELADSVDGEPEGPCKRNVSADWKRRKEGGAFEGPRGVKQRKLERQPPSRKFGALAASEEGSRVRQGPGSLKGEQGLEGLEGGRAAETLEGRKAFRKDVATGVLWLTEALQSGLGPGYRKTGAKPEDELVSDLWMDTDGKGSLEEGTEVLGTEVIGGEDGGEFDTSSDAVSPAIHDSNGRDLTQSHPNGPAGDQVDLGTGAMGRGPPSEWGISPKLEKQVERKDGLAFFGCAACGVEGAVGTVREHPTLPVIVCEECLETYDSANFSDRVRMTEKVRPKSWSEFVSCEDCSIGQPREGSRSHRLESFINRSVPFQSLSLNQLSTAPEHSLKQSSFVSWKAKFKQKPNKRTHHAGREQSHWKKAWRRYMHAYRWDCPLRL
jgi:hypothetical protein